MHQSLSLEEIKTNKVKELCPKCNSETEEFMFKEDGEEFEAKKCTKEGCFWWGGVR